ncbi:MAG TPA: hypothetical protein PL044_00280 [Clostridiales bacterium]|nr:MAG: hypothetical protein BWY37_01285 [Firmicutes bacterium ADurb.Bin262]HOU09836.1 hypothetical protein [Clostridiales bacterium]HQK72203.1 hypothetical protein [Clostridiales bacterium]
MDQRARHKRKYNFYQKLLDGLLLAAGALFPSPAFPRKKNYKSGGFYPGTGDSAAAAPGAKWRLGFASDTLLTGNELDGNHFVGGVIARGRKTATEVYDDMRVRAAAVSAGGGGTAVFAALDLYGLTNRDVRIIRSRLADYAVQKGIVSINLMSLHQHSVVDTFGMNGELKQAFLVNPLKNLVRRKDIKSGKNPAFMENLFRVTANTIKAACENMEPGELFFGAADAAAYVVDHRPPFVNDTALNRLRFRPDNPASRETWLVTWCAHCGGNGPGNRQITSDYPYYMEKAVREESGANLLLILGAIQSNAMNKDSALLGLPAEHTAVDTMDAYGRALARLLAGIGPGSEEAVEPILSIRHREVFLPLSNRLMIFVFKTGLFTNAVVRTKLFGYALASEIGWARLGRNIAVALIPGELEPSLAYGGTLGAGESWSGKAWDLPSLKDMAGENQKLLVFGLANDQIGYIVADNDFVPMMAPETVHVEMVSIDRHCASTLMTAFEQIARPAQAVQKE